MGKKRKEKTLRERKKEGKQQNEGSKIRKSKNKIRKGKWLRKRKTDNSEDERKISGKMREEK